MGELRIQPAFQFCSLFLLVEDFFLSIWFGS